MILALEYGPRDGVLEWASDVIEAHPYHQVIIMTHCYLNWDATLVSDATAHSATHSSFVNTEENPANAADQVWDKLISKHSNIIMKNANEIISENLYEKTYNPTIDK